MATTPIVTTLYYTGTRRVLTMPNGFSSQVTVHLWGAGGAGGGADSYGGGAGTGGQYYTGTFTVNPGDTIEIDVGGGGERGYSGGGVRGGNGGASRLNLGPYNSFSGGTGGTSGGSGGSGSGGGGGGATLFVINGSLAGVAGGGGAGGGGGQYGGGGDASTSAVGSGTAGANGAGHSGDGGAGGAGGGGLPGGDGGSGASGDGGGTGGYVGGGGSGSGVTAPGGTGSSYWISPYGYGNGNSASGYDGLAVIIFTPLALGAVKNAGTYKDVRAAWVRHAGAWRTITNVWTKIDGQWKELTNLTLPSFSFSSTADNFGIAGRGATGSTGSGGNSGGGKIICTKLYELGFLPKDIYEADQAFGAKLLEEYPDIYNGYRAWAEIVVDWMQASGPNMMFWIRDNEYRMHRQVKWSTEWAKQIAEPWAEEMAYRMGTRETGNNIGKALMLIGIPISKVVGVWQRVVGPSKKPAGLIKGSMLVAVFCLLKAIVTVGNILKVKKSKEQPA